MTESSKMGLVNFLNRLLSNRLKNPAFKDSVRSVMQNIDPDSTPKLAKTIMWQETEFFLGLLGAVPRIANVFISLVDEILNELTQKFSPELLEGYVESMIDEIDKEAIKRIQVNYNNIFKNLTPILKVVWQEIKMK